MRRNLPPPVPAGEVRYPGDPSAKEVTDEERAARSRVEAEIARNLAGSDWPAAAPGKERVIFMDGESGKEYELEFDVEQLAAFAALAHARGVNNPTDDVDVPEEAAPEEPNKAPQAWSSGIDSRVNKGTSTTYPANDVRLRKLGRVNGGCSGNLVGRRLVLTAAHCVTDASYSYATHTFEARRSGTSTHYGTETSVGVWWSGQWQNNQCATAGQYVYADCSPNDWALILLRDDVFTYGQVGYVHPGWLGYDMPVYAEDNASSYAYNDGYPGCGTTTIGKPDPCVANTPYGQTFNCKLGLPEFLGSDGYYQRIRHGCDTSAGHSGSSVISTYSNGITLPPYVIGIHHFEHCFGADCNDLTGSEKLYPSGMRAITPYLKNWLSNKRATYP